MLFKIERPACLSPPQALIVGVMSENGWKMNLLRNLHCQFLKSLPTVTLCYGTGARFDANILAA
jgi:hypothetical protein